MHYILSYTVGLIRPQAGDHRVHSIDAFKRCVTEMVCWLTGGCTSRVEHGFWVMGADISRKTYPGAMMPEEAWTVEVCVPEADVDRIHASIKDSIVANALRWEVDTNWVHATRVNAKALHFSVDEERMK